MPTTELLAYVEDEPTKAVLNAVVTHVNRLHHKDIAFRQGFPSITRGFGNLKKQAMRFYKTNCPTPVVFVTDLDTHACIHELAREWFPVTSLNELTDKFIFRIAVHEIESWIMSDGEGLARYLDISATNFPVCPDEIEDPKQYLLNVIRSKCRKKRFKEMLPSGNQAVGVEYNPVLIDYVANKWNAENAAAHSPSLNRMIQRFIKL